MIWREKQWLLIVLAILLIANTVFFFTYRVQYQSRLDALDERLAQAQGQLDEAKRARASAEQTLKGFHSVEKDVAVVYDEYWSTEGKRLTEMIAEVKRLATASNLIPQSYSFDRRVAVGANQQQRTKGEVGAVEVGVSFVVLGTYEQTRRLINLLELSNQFVIIDQISLAQADGERLSLNLHIKTIFREGAPQTPPKNRL
ncbi:MAG: hypothetical protein ACTHQM_22700 [Thermoanaerobaculia bacterium]